MKKESVIKLKKELVDIGKEISKQRLIVGPGGNISARLNDIIYVKSSGICFEDAKPEDYIGVNLNTGEIIEKTSNRPTCELSMHIGCYLANNDVKAVIHTHPPLATAYAMLGIPLKAFTPDFVAVIGDSVPVIKYVIPGTVELANEIVKFIRKGYKCVFMGNHGLITVGTNLKEALYRTILVEDSCKTVIASKILGKMKFFTDKEIEQIDNLEIENYRRQMLKLKK